MNKLYDEITKVMEPYDKKHLEDVIARIPLVIKAIGDVDRDNYKSSREYYLAKFASAGGKTAYNIYYSRPIQDIEKILTKTEENKVKNRNTKFSSI